MSRSAWRHRAAPWVLLPGALLSASCSDEGFSGTGPVPETGPSVAYGIWTPGPNDTCTRAIHDGYSVVGPDGKRYPTWHPPVDPATGCSFGHEHGRDPRGSKLYRDVGPIPFGLANEALETWDPQNPRREDHVGHKIEWENDVELVRGDGVTGALFTVKCDVLVKLHQGTHSKDAFTNNLHEVAYHVRCSDGTEMHVTALTAIGDPGGFNRSCDRQRVDVGPATPANSPNGGGIRLIPDRTCVEQYMKTPPGIESDFDRALHESWEISQSVVTEHGRHLAHFNPYFQVFYPSRFHDPAAAGLVGRPIEVCYEVNPDGRRAQGELCDQSTGNGTVPGVAYDDPRSRFNGVLRFVDINDNEIRNAGGPEVWYTDPFGRNGRRRPFPGSVRQWVASLDNDYGFNLNGPAIGFRRDDGGAGVHAPN